MYEASSYIDIEFRPGAARHRRPVIVSMPDNSQGQAAEIFAQLLAGVAKDRDKQAFSRLFQYFGPRLKTFFMRWSVSSGVAEDLVQETMLNVWRKASYFDGARASVSTWIFTIARNVRIDYLRRQRDPSTLLPDPEQAPVSIEDGVLGAERDERVRRALTGLSMEQQTIIRLSYFSEKSQTEIADELGIPLGTVKSRTRLAMNHLRALLEDEA